MSCKVKRTDLEPHLRGDVFLGHCWGILDADTPRDLTGYSGRIHFVTAAGEEPGWRTSTSPGEGEGSLSLLDGDGRELEDGTVLAERGYPYLLRLDRQVPGLPAGVWEFDVEFLPPDSTEPETWFWGCWQIDQDRTV